MAKPINEKMKAVYVETEEANTGLLVIASTNNLQPTIADMGIPISAGKKKGKNMAKSNAAKTKKIALISNYRLTRQKLNLNQAEFWNRLGSTQSTGSRYETGREVPIATAILAHKVYILGEDIDARNYK